MVDKVETTDAVMVDKVETTDALVIDKLETSDSVIVDNVEIADAVVLDKVEAADAVVVDKVETADAVVDKVDTKEEKIIGINSELFFKIQLGAYSSEKSSVVFGNLPDIHFIKVGNIFKYYSGKFTNEADARAIIPQAKAKGFKGAFLVRFKNGKRI